MLVKAEKNDLVQIMEIINSTVTEMKSYNNTQWDENYPQADDFNHDIEKGELYVTKDGEKVKGFICINYIEPSEYAGLDWSSDEECMVIHRMAVNSNYRKMGIGKKLMEFAEKLALENGVNYLKTDTYSINDNMNALFKKFNYKFIGEMIFLGKEHPFNCYDKLLSK